MFGNTGVLLLNATFQPLCVVPLGRAICLIVMEEALILEEAEGKEPVRSQYLNVPFPSVIRMREFRNVPFQAQRTRLNTRMVLSRDDYQCCYCEEEADTIDHVYPTSRGGKNQWTNVVAACVRCNTTKSDRLLEELGWEMRFQPTIPPGQHWLNVGMSERKQWNKYLPKVS